MRNQLIHPDYQVAILGQSIFINCSVKNSIWLKDSDELPEGVSIIDRYLRIPRVAMEHYGVYTCIDPVSQEQGESTLYVGGNKYLVSNLCF